MSEESKRKVAPRPEVGGEGGLASKISRRAISRRTIATSMAWSVPALVLASPAQAATCSPLVNPITITATTANVNGGPLASQIVTIPSNVTTVSFTVVGGGGGNEVNTRGVPATVTGTFAGPAAGGPTQVTLIAGGGGQGGAGLTTSQTLLGGTGYGNGGNAFGGEFGFGGGGGGGSAILLGNTLTGTPLVVAGGAGGGAGSDKTGSATETINLNLVSPANSRDGGLLGQPAGPGSSVTGMTDQILPNPAVTVLTFTASGGANGATGGAPGTGTILQPGGAGTAVVSGAAGQSHTSSGGNGGNGAVPPPGTPDGGAVGGGGGGGGYAGGAGGGFFFWSNPSTGIFGWAGLNGGGGSSFVDPSVLTSSSSTGTFTGTFGPGQPGSVQLSFAC